MLELVLWAVACLVLPVVWGIGVHAAFEAFRPRSEEGDDRHLPDYQI